MLTQDLRWRTFSDTRMAVRLKYPQTTAQGHIVKVTNASVGGGIRAHFIAKDSPELYFEVTWYASLSARDGYERLKEEVEKRFEEVNVSELKESRLGSLPAFAFSFSWREGERAVVYVPKGRIAYRILYDPRSPLNSQMLSTVELL